MEPVAIVGYMGCGKSAVGRILADRLGGSFVDLDDEITARAGLSIPEIFSRYGEDHFRELESRALHDALDGARDRTVACGGGIIIRPENRERLEGVATVFLREEPEVMYQRTRGEDRPLRGVGREEFERRYAERLPYYEEVSNLKVEVDGRSAVEVAKEIARWLSA